MRCGCAQEAAEDSQEWLSHLPCEMRREIHRCGNSQRWCRGPHCAGRRFRPAKPSGTQKTRRRENGRKRQEKAAGLKPGATKFGGSRGQPGMGVPPAAKRRARSVVPHKKDAGLKPGATRLGDSGQPGMAVPRAAKQRARSVVPSRKMLG